MYDNLSVENHKKFDWIYYILLPLVVPIFWSISNVISGQDLNGDNYNYHLYDAYAWLNGRADQDLAPAGAHSYFNPYLDTFSFYLIQHLGGIPAQLICGFIDGMVAFPIFFIVRYFLNDKKYSIILSYLCSFACPMFIVQVGASNHDNFVALLDLVGLSFLLYSLKSSRKYSLCCAGILFGVAFGLKLTAATFIPVCFILLLFFSKEKIKDLCIAAFASFSGILLSSGAWYWHLYHKYGNPVFPFMNNIFKSTYASTDKNATRDMYFLTFHGMEKILYPFYFSDHFNRVDAAGNAFSIVNYSFMFCFVFILLYSVSTIQRFGIKESLKKKENILIVLFLSSFYIWQYEFGVYRYLMAIDLLAPFLIFIFCQNIFENMFRKTDLSKVLALSVAGFIVFMNFSKGLAIWGRGEFTSPYLWTDAPSEVKKADVTFLGSWFSGWIVPAIEPAGHVVGVNKGILDFRSQKYIDQYFNFKETKNKIIIFTHNEPWRLEEDKKNSIQFLDKNYHLYIDFSQCHDFNTRFSSVKSTATYCIVKEKNNS